MKKNLPVILLKGIILLPYNDIRLEFDNDISKTIIDSAELFHDNKVLVVSQPDPLEEMPDIKDLPKMGVLSKISHKIELPNGKTRVVITGVSRVKIIEYLKPTVDMMEAIIETLPKEEIDDRISSATSRKLYREIEQYVKSVPYISNSLLALISDTKNISKMTDITVSNLQISNERIFEYLTCTNSLERTEMILNDIYKEEEMFNIEKNLDLKVKKELDNSQKEYLLREKMKVIKEELGDISLKDDEIFKLRERLNNLECNDYIKRRIDNEIKRYESLPSMSAEIGIIRNYIECLLELPWNKCTKDVENLNKVRKSLDESHYGLDKVKTRIIEYLAVKKQTNSLKGPIICLVGPPGVGKTTLAFSIAKSINREFVKISVGGVNDEAEIIGHRKTYLGASCGRIIDGLRRVKTNNPVFLIDEIDKMTHDYKGDPASALLEVLDSNQNKFFKDNYVEEEVDLSNVMFILTANNIESIPAPLKDRLEIVDLSGYTEYEKLDIAKNHLLPKLCEEHGIKPIKIDDNILLETIRYYTKEAGVRELERQLATIIRKVVTQVVMENKKLQKNIFTSTNLEVYLGKKKYLNTSIEYNNYIGIANGLAYTYYGGDVLPIEVNFFKGEGKLILTGSLGKVMQESANIALSYVKANYKYFKINYENLTNNDIHIHVPEGSINKDGPSAGIALTTALISAFSNLKISKTLAMTGEVTLRGKVLPIGGLKEKSIGALRNGIETIIIPYDNIKDLDEVPDEVKENIEYISVKDYKEIYRYISDQKYD